MNTEKADGGPAFPFPSDAGAGEPGELGMTLRDYFAAKAMQGVIASSTDDHEIDELRCAQWCYGMADAMLKARQA